MSVRSFFYPRQGPELKMPRSNPGERDELGIAWNGDVLNGKLSVDLALAGFQCPAEPPPAPPGRPMSLDTPRPSTRKRRRPRK